jgi:hypothetical protein
MLDLASRPSVVEHTVQAELLNLDYVDLCVSHEGVNLTINVEDLRPGDVVCFVGGKKSYAVSMLQSFFLPEKASRITHVGILDSRLNLWEANPSKHITKLSIKDLISGGRTIAVVRPTARFSAAEIDAAIGFFAGSKYRFTIEDAGSLLTRALSKRKNEVNFYQEGIESAYCSSFVVHCLSLASGSAILKDLPLVFPGDFVDREESFLPVDLRWAAVEITTE